MSISLIVAAVLSVWLGIAHSVIGERLMLKPLIALDPPPAPIGTSLRRNVMRLAWHATSITWVGIGGIFLHLSRVPSDPTGQGVLLVLALTFAAMLALSLYWTRGRHRSWVFTLAIAIASAMPLILVD